MSDYIRQTMNTDVVISVEMLPRRLDGGVRRQGPGRRP
ncbi:hypothetical protein ABI_23170 [Asticcacaulis biprosthecium C19]|uniref:Uncharacterized protein n=1 Tax=Asticcacaulis biprosthecium C19 TaxID=715226 RepID=F4QNJ7_9CAUL|nr:hypothetical protein ABI_23170 [Asticcacaulis biprosthecium C19]